MGSVVTTIAVVIFTLSILTVIKGLWDQMTMRSIDIGGLDHSLLRSRPVELPGNDSPKL